MSQDVVYNLDLHCTGEPNSRTKVQTVSFRPSSPPYTVGDLARRIEEDFEIPRSMVKLEIDLVPLKSENRLEEYKVRDGDKFDVYYYSEADCREIDNCIEWMEKLLDKLRTTWRIGRAPTWALPFYFIRKGDCLEDLCNSFSPWMNPRTYANKIHFISRDGLALTSDIMKLLGEVSIENLPNSLKIIESRLLDCLWSITENDFIRQIVIQSGAIENCTKTLLRVPVDAEFHSTDYYAKEIILGSLGLIANVCEIPTARLQICSNHAVIKQIFSLTLCPEFEEIVVHRVAMILISLTYSRENHQNLILHDAFKKVIQKDKVDNSRGDTHTLIRFNKAVFYSILVLVSPQYFTTELKILICEILNSFVKNANIVELSEFEQEYEIYWGTLLPLVKVLYEAKRSTDSVDTSLFALSKETILVTLQCLLLKPFHCSVLVNEGLVDYVLCLPLYSTATEMQEKAKTLVTMIRQAPDIHYQPPSLLNMSKAAVAVYYCGLDDVMRLTVPELAYKLWYNLT